MFSNMKNIEALHVGKKTSLEYKLGAHRGDRSQALQFHQ